MKKYEITQSEKQGRAVFALWRRCVSVDDSKQPPCLLPAIFRWNPNARLCAVFWGFMSPPAHAAHPRGEGENVPSFEKYRWRHISAKSWKCFKKGTLKLYHRGTPRPRLPVLRTQCDNTKRSLKRRWLWGAVKSPVPPPFFHEAQSVLHCCSFVARQCGRALGFSS